MKKICSFLAKIEMISAKRIARKRIEEILGSHERLPDAVKPVLEQQVLPDAGLQVFRRIRSTLRDYLMDRATRHEMLGWVTNPDNRHEIMERVTDLKDEFEGERARYMDSYEEAAEAYLMETRERLDGFARANEFVAVLREAQPTKEYVSKRIRFTFLKPRIWELDPEEEGTIVDGIYARTAADLAAASKEALRLKGIKSQVRAVEKLVRKLHGMDYFDARYGVIGNELADVIAAIPMRPDGKVEPHDEMLASAALAGVWSVLGNEDKLGRKLEAGERLFPAQSNMEGIKDVPRQEAMAIPEPEPRPEPERDKAEEELPQPEDESPAELLQGDDPMEEGEGVGAFAW